MARTIRGLQAAAFGAMVALALGFGASQAVADTGVPDPARAKACSWGTCVNFCKSSCTPKAKCHGYCDPVDGCVCYYP